MTTTRTAGRTEKLLRNGAFGGVLAGRLLADQFSHPPSKYRATGRTIAIVGGELFNKGAQAMTFTVIDQLRRRQPDAKFVLLSGGDFARPREEREQYRFRILPWGPDVTFQLLAPRAATLSLGRWPGEAIQRVRSRLSRAKVLIDISGFALTSQFSFRKSLLYISNLSVARRLGIPTFLLPQSFGPLDYPWWQKTILDRLLHTYLPDPMLIFSREANGVTLLHRYTRSNVEHAFDLVLQHKDYRLENIFRSPPNLRNIRIASNSVGLIPNLQVARRSPPGALDELYRKVVNTLLEQGKRIYVLRHATEDLKLCRRIKQMFGEDNRVVLFEQDFHALELEAMIANFQFVVASRYHSIVHAYRNEVPAVAIGWADKYFALLEAFDQTDYAFDGREDLKTNHVLKAVRTLSKSWPEEGEKIRERLKKIRSEPVLDRVL